MWHVFDFHYVHPFNITTLFSLKDELQVVTENILRIIVIQSQ